MRVERTCLATPLDYKDDKCPHGLRVGWSTPDASLLLGEDRFPQIISRTCVLPLILILIVSCQAEREILLRMTDAV